MRFVIVKKRESGGLSESGVYEIATILAKGLMVIGIMRKVLLIFLYIPQWVKIRKKCNLEKPY